MADASPTPLVAIACGGTGGHLFPGLAVAEALQGRGGRVQLLVSAKEVDQQVVRALRGMEVLTLPAAPPSWRRFPAFVRSFAASWRGARTAFRCHRPSALLAMGGFMAAPTALAARAERVLIFLHEANSIPGRANRWLAPLAREVYVYFPEAARRWEPWHPQRIGMPVRTMFQPLDPAPCRTALGLDPDKPVLLVMGGSQGASPLNRVVLQTLSAFAAHEPSLQFLHLTGPAEVERVRQAYEHHRRRAVVHPFLTEMDLAFGAATVAVTRAGASSLAEQAAMRVPSVLIPYPQAADDHQDHNARAFVETGAARMLRQAEATPEALLREVRGLLHDAAARCALQAALGSWHQPDAAERIAQRLLNPLAARTARSRPDALPPRMGLDPLTPEPSSTHSHARPD